MADTTLHRTEGTQPKAATCLPEPDHLPRAAHTAPESRTTTKPVLSRPGLVTEKDGADPAPDTGLLSGTSSGDQGASTPSICAPKTSPAPERMRGAQPPTKRSEGGLDTERGHRQHPSRDGSTAVQPWARESPPRQLRLTVPSLQQLGLRLGGGSGHMPELKDRLKATVPGQRCHTLG